MQLTKEEDLQALLARFIYSNEASQYRDCETLFLFQNAIRREESFSTMILDFSDVPYI